MAEFFSRAGMTRMRTYNVETEELAIDFLGKKLKKNSLKYRAGTVRTKAK